MGRSRLSIVVAACAIFAAVVIVTPATHPYLRRLADAAGILHPIPPLRPGSPFPSIAVTALNGTPETLAGGAARGTVVYNVFTSWCPSCRMEAPLLALEAPRLERRGIRLIGIDQGESGGAVSRFAAAFHLGYPIVIDPNSTTTATLSARVIPETIVVRNGTVEEMAIGPLTPGFLNGLSGGL